MTDAPNRKAIYDDEVEFSHESYGMAGFSRITGSSGRLFGSSLPSTHTFIRLCVTRAVRRHHLGRDWFHGNGKILMEIDLSPAQFAELLTSMNVGSGVPCTLRVAEGRRMEPCPEEKLEAEQVRHDFKAKTEQTAKNMDATAARIEAILEKPAIGKADRAEIRSLLGLVIQDVRSNMPFWLKSFHEATGKIVTHAKAEIDSFITHAVIMAGVKALASPPIEVPVMLTEGETKANPSAEGDP